MDFKDKVIIVTGSSAGIGAFTAKYLAKLSAKLVITGRNEEKLKEVAAICEEAKGIKPLVVRADVTKDNDVRKIVDETVKTFGKIDVLINNAGLGTISTIEDGIEPFDRMISTNLRSAYLLTSLVIPYLKMTKGNIINISSVAAFVAIPEFLPYCISKAGMDIFTRCLAKDLAKYGIRVNSVNPGPTESEFHNRLGLGQEATDKMMECRAEQCPLKKIATSEDVAELVLFLASDKAKSITGSIHTIDNGYSA